MPAGMVTVDMNWPTAASEDRFTTAGDAVASSSATSAPLPSTTVIFLIVTQTLEYSVARLSVM